MRRFITVLFVLCLATLPVAQSRTSKGLELYLIDVEGGGAMLFVTPSGESVLIDTGNGGQAASRDAGRIMDAVKDAGLTQIDNLIITHWHGDHYGGVAGVPWEGPHAPTSATRAPHEPRPPRGTLFTQ